MSKPVRNVKRPAAAPLSPLAARAWIALFTVLAIMASMMMWSAALLILVGLLPSLAAILIDREEGNPLTRAVAAANAVGILAVVLDFRSGPNTTAHALAALGNGLTLLKMFGAAGLGWMIYLGLPTIMLTFLEHADAARHKVLRKRQEELIKEWGAETRGEDSGEK
ncbi:MAG: hypothetical protein EXQ88_03030 [Alphaproteobacteria bacterium]|nr:hypothetical protein [Alphaproteobacteria bacterium]